MNQDKRVKARWRMQAEESPRAVTSERSGLKPTTAFLLLLLGAAAVAAIYLTRPAAAPTPTGTQSTSAPNFALTNEEAIAKFEELNTQRIAMYESRDVSFAEEFLAEGSPLKATAAKEVAQLIDDGVWVQTNFDTKRVRVVSNEPDEIRIRQVVVERPIFKDSNGDDLTRSAPQRRVVDWSLVLDGSEWKLFNLEVVRSSKS